MVYVSLVKNTVKKHLSIALSMGLQHRIFSQNRKHHQICENEMENTIGNTKKITLPSLLSITSGTSIGSDLGSSMYHSYKHSSIGALPDFLNVFNVKFFPNGQFSQAAAFGNKRNTNANSNDNTKGDPLNQFGIGSDLKNFTFSMEHSNNNNNSNNNSNNMNENNIGNPSEYLSSDVDVNLTNLHATVRTEDTKRIHLNLTRPTTERLDLIGINKHLDKLLSTPNTKYYTASTIPVLSCNNTTSSIVACNPRAEPITNRTIDDNHLLNNTADVYYDHDVTRNEYRTLFHMNIAMA